MKIGIDIGGTNTVWGIVDKDGRIIKRNSFKTFESKHFEDFLLALQNSLQPSIDEIGEENFEGIGIGAPNGNFHTGCIEFAPNLAWANKIIPLAEEVSKKFKLETVVTNDANAAAIGEMKFGAAKGVDDFIMITLGTGVGSGFVSNGQLIYGHDGLAGELGHTIAIRDGRDCGCGRKGCLETYTSATGIVRTALEKLSDTHSILKSEANINSYTIFQAAKAGDELALEIFDFTGKILGQSLADAVAITSPSMIIIFGGLAQAGKYIFDPIQKYFDQNVLKVYKDKVKIVPSLLKANDVAILGAAALI